MRVTIHTVQLGFDHCYIVQGEGTIMIDAGAPKKKQVFMKCIDRLKITPSEINLIIVTHGHWDHIGSAKEIKEITGAKIAMHENEREWLEKALIQLPPGVTLWGRTFASIVALLKPLIHVPSTKVDIVLREDEVSLLTYGIPGKILHTPGHSSGSVSVLLETGDVFVGDLLMNKFPLRLSPGLPIFAEDMSILKRSLEALLENGAKTIYPAHGKPFSAKIVEKELLKITDDA